MHAILGYTKLGFNKIEKMPRETLGSYLQEIQNSGNRLLTLINDLLDLSKLQTGKIFYIFEMSSMSATIQDVFKEFQALAEEKNTRLELVKTDLADNLMMDKDKVRQVITNLLSNAIKFSEQGGKIETELTKLDDKIKVSIRDYGIGIPEEELETIFDKFTQSSKTTSQSGGT